ncbi:MAG: hypothetical protein MK132_01670 [Lentisphaerales bacterium]|nr:hypothetical protein [Lentisphaerales bacterium]
MKAFQFFLLSFLFVNSGFSLERILVENLDVVDFCLMDHYNLEESHPSLQTYYERCENSVVASLTKRNLRDVLASKHMNEDFTKMILSAYQRRNLTEAKLLLSYLIADFNDYENYKDSFRSRLINFKKLLRHSNDVPHFFNTSKRISFVRNQLSFNYKGQIYTITIEPNSKRNISTVKSSGYFDILSHALRSLMQVGRFTPVDISLSRKENGAPSSYLDPNYLLFKLHSMTRAEDSPDMAMLGDVDSQGNCIRYYYMRSSLDGLSKDEKYILVSREAKEQILEVVKIEGIEVLSEKIFIAPKSINDAFAIIDNPGKYLFMADTYKILMASIKQKSKWPGIIKALDRLLEKDPGFLSAEILKDVLTGKVKKQLSFASSFREFNLFFRLLDIDNNSTAQLVYEVKSEIAKVVNIIHPELRTLVRDCDEIADHRLKLFKNPRPSAVSKKGTTLSRGGSSYRTVSQQLYKKIREVRLKRDILLDKQNVLESIFDR